MNNKQKVEKILKENLYMTISVASEKGKPWIANLYYAYDNNHNFYWYSPKDSVHSKTIRENPHIAISIFDSTAVGDDIDAVYIKAKAHEVTKKSELIKGLTVYAAKMVKTKFANKAQASKFVKGIKDFDKLSKIRMYKAVPEVFYKLAPSEIFNDKFVDSRIEVKI